MPVGVFVNPDIRVVATAVRRARLGAVQLSGDETPEQCARIAREVGVRVIKALRLRSEADLKVVEAYIAAGVTPLLDTPAPGLYGGAGETGDWSLARRVAAEWPIMLAGGLTPSNVVDAIETVAPRGVDVSSGVETERAKNLGLIEAFIAMARSA